MELLNRHRHDRLPHDFAMTGSATPSGPAGGDMDGTYPDPTVAADAVTFAKMQNIASDRLLGRDTASSGDVEELTVGGGLAFTGSGGIGIDTGGVTNAMLAGSIALSKIDSEAASTWTPGVSGTGWAYTAGARYGYSQQVGNIVVASFGFVFGATGDGGSGQLSVTGFPVAAHGSIVATGTGYYVDATFPTKWPAFFELSGTTATVDVINVGFNHGFYVALTETVPAAFAAGDGVFGTIVYLADT